MKSNVTCTVYMFSIALLQFSLWLVPAFATLANEYDSCNSLAPDIVYNALSCIGAASAAAAAAAGKVQFHENAFQ